MTKLVLKISLLFVFLISLSLQATVSLETKSQDQALQRMKTQQISKSFEISPEFVRFPLYFIQNKGQVDEEALFFSKASKSTPSLKKEGLMSDDFKEKSPEGKSGKGTDEMLQFTAGGHVLGFQKGDVFIASGDHALRIEFLNARPVSPENEGTSPDTENNRQAAKPLARVYYRDLWEGVTLVYERNNDCVVKSTYTVQPGGTTGTSPVDRIRLRYNVPVTVDDSDNLVFSFETGEMKESRPKAWQEINGEHIPVEVSFRSLGERKVGFKVGSYDPHFPLVIDPVLSWNTFMGSSSEDKGWAIAVDGSGNVYV
ncbi:hypothetical protein KA005_26550, partial [bacterium]|nr:hypothetical protein [bacterium]